MQSDETPLYFVKVDESDGKYLQQAFEKAKSRELDVAFISGKELLENGVDEDQTIFVTDEFAGDVFEFLLANKKRIFGPICVLQCINNCIPLPNTIHPLFCLAMSGAIVTCTNIAKPLREKLKQLIERMNGVFARNLTDAITHLVAGEVGSVKYATAARLNKPIVLPSWVEDAWQQKDTEYQLDGTDLKFVDKHRCPIFKGCSICVSGLSGRRKDEIKRLVEEHGGIYLPELKLKGSTHLLIEKPTGQKFYFALRWSVRCVQPDWLYDCIKAGCWIEESPYAVKPDNDANCTGGSNATLSTTTVDATMNSTSLGCNVSRKAAEVAKKSAESYGSKDLTNNVRQSSLTRIQTSGLKSLHKSKDRTNKDRECDYNVLIPSGEQFLDGCQLYMTGFNQSQLDYLQRIINAGGGTRFNHFNLGVTHVVVGDQPAQDIEKLIKPEFSPHVVTVQWLLESCRQVKCLPEQEYYCFESNEVFEEDGKSNKGNDNETRVPEQTVDNEGDEIFKQYLHMMPSDNQPALVKGAATEKNLHGNDGKNTNNKPEEIPENNNMDITDLEPNERMKKKMNHDCTRESREGDDEQNVLHALNFRLDGFTEEQEMLLQEDIENYGGNVLSNQSKAIADFLVVPLNYECKKKRARNVVTYCWLERCVESGEILEPRDEFLFTPFSLPDEVFPLQDCVISISQYADVEREHLMHLIEILGGHFQEYFSRVAKTNVLANTHLIVEEPLGSKYKAAVNWNIPAVSAEWLYQCAQSGDKVLETPYLLSSKKSATRKGDSRVERDETGVENNHKEELEDNTNNVLNGFSVPQNVSETGDKSEEPLNEKTKDKEVASKKLPFSMKVPAFFGKPQLPTFDLTDALEYLQSPCASSGSSSAHSRLSRSSRNSFLMDDLIQEQLQAAVKNTGNLLESRKNDHDGHSIDKAGTRVDKEGTSVDKERSTIDKEDSTIDKERSTIDKEDSTIDKEDSTIDKEDSTIDKERSTIDKEDSTIDKEDSTIDKEDHQEGKGESSFLNGVVLSVSKKCAKQLSSIYNMASSAGAQCRDSLAGGCTHLIHEGRLTREQTKAKSKGVHVVSPHWLYDCIEQKCHLVESLYPSDYNPKLALSLVTTRRSTRSNKETGDDTKVAMEKTDNTLSQDKEDTHEGQAETTTDEATKEFPMDDLGPSELEAMLSQSSAQSDSLRNREEIERLKNLMDSLKTTRRRSSRLHNSGNSGHSRNSSEYSNPRRQSSRLRSLRASEDNSQDDGDNGRTVEGEIIYDDPNSRHERQKIIAQLEDCSPSVHKGPDLKNIADRQMNKSTNNDASSYLEHSIKKESLSPTSPIHSSTPTAPPIALHITSKSSLPEPVSLLDSAEEPAKVVEKPRPKFILSTMTQQEKIDYGALIEELGGVIFDNQFFNPASRHTIAGQLNRNEKCLSSIAAGNWLLRKSYLEECRKAGHFVDEEAHEWGVPIPRESLSSLAVASRRWRYELAKKSARANKKIGAFQDWKVLLCVEEGKAGSFTRMLEAGGAKVLGTVPPFQNIVHVTHAFISPSAALVSNIDFNRLQQAEILVLRTDYIVDYLTAGNKAPDTSIYFYQPSNVQSSRKRKERESGSPETLGKKKRGN